MQSDVKRRSVVAGDDGQHASALRIEDVGMTFGQHHVLNNVSMSIERGEVHALVGQNGSGKSTLVKILGGYHVPDPGSRVYVGGRPMVFGSGNDSKAAGLRFVHQDLALVEALTVAENFHLARPGHRLRPLSPGDERTATNTALASLGYDLDVRATVRTLGAAERTAVAIAKAIYGSGPPSILVLDEPTASLPREEAEHLFSAINHLTETGTSVLYISHYIDEVLEVADQISILRDGELVSSQPADTFTHDGLTEAILGRKLAAVHRTKLHAPAGNHLSKPCLELRDVAAPPISRLDLTVGRGEIVAVAGLTGSGRDQLGPLLIGQVHHDGTVKIDGATVRPSSPASSVAAGMGYVPAERRRDGLLLTGTIRENLTLADLSPFWRRMRYRQGAEKRHAAEWIGDLDLRPADSERLVQDLSGGNQQKVVLGRWLRIRPPVLVLDEPTQGVDVGAKESIWNLIAEAASQGSAVLLCSTDTEELSRVAHRVLILSKGRISCVLEGDELTASHIEEALLHGALSADEEKPTNTRTIGTK